MDNNLSLLGIAKKAGLLAIGDESVGTAARAKKARVILSASDASDGSKRRARGYGEAYNAVHVIIPYDKAELGMVIGRGTPGMLAVLDTGLAAGFLSGLAGDSPEEYGQAAELLKKKAARAAERKKNTAGKGKKQG